MKILINGYQKIPLKNALKMKFMLATGQLHIEMRLGYIGNPIRNDNNA